MYIQRITTIINVCLITVAAYFGVIIFYDIVGAHLFALPEKPQTAVEPAVQITTANTPLTDYRHIVERDLFKVQHTEPPKEVEPSLELEDLEETQLKLKLWGTVSGTPESTYAVIEDTQKREQNLYRIGDVIQEANLKAILRGKVVLVVDGKDEILTMEEVQQTRASTASRRRGATPVRTSSSSQPTDAVRVRTQRISLNRSMIEDAMQDISKLATEITITPHVDEEGQSSGLALRNIKPNSIFRRMGLRNGDILMGVDGQEIQSVDDALQLYESLKTASGVKVQIQRRGQERTIDYNIR